MLPVKHLSRAPACRQPIWRHRIAWYLRYDRPISVIEHPVNYLTRAHQLLDTTLYKASRRSTPYEIAL
ncbi:hypothetical protein BDFB_013683 [Asbolus verrucosus]|uniref:Uncharacterized protein n=1 Tax=Asbolus verrucosus TaxID=1661398 RepID=A0A482VRD7_ASBVE|nr:hypothetical protein BDFB_013683 [Asbolus verrucosus]